MFKEDSLFKKLGKSKNFFIMETTIFYGKLEGLTEGHKAARISEITETPHTGVHTFMSVTYWPLKMLRIEETLDAKNKYFQFAVPTWIWDNKVNESAQEFKPSSFDQFVGATVDIEVPSIEERNAEMEKRRNASK